MKRIDWSEKKNPGFLPSLRADEGGDKSKSKAKLGESGAYLNPNASATKRATRLHFPLTPTLQPTDA